jgi:hypothetical protein
MERNILRYIYAFVEVWDTMEEALAERRRLLDVAGEYIEADDEAGYIATRQVYDKAMEQYELLERALQRFKNEVIERL